MNAWGKGEAKGDCLSWAFCLILIIFKFESLLYLQLWLRCYDSSNIAVTLTGKGQPFTYSFLQLEFHPFLTPFSIPTYAWIHLVRPSAVLFFSKKLLQSSLGASSWAGSASFFKTFYGSSSQTLCLNFHPLFPGIQTVLHILLSATRGPGSSQYHSSRASEPLSCFLEKGARLPVCLSSVWTPAVPHSASRKQIS